MNIPPELIEAFGLINEIKKPVLEYRIHYDKNGFITGCTMSEHPDNLNYIVVDKETYDNYFRYDKVINGKLRKIIFDPGYRVQLIKSTSGYQVVKNHAALILEDKDIYNDTEYYNGPNN